MIAVDGKTARGARIGDGKAVHLFAALDQHTGAVLGQAAVEAKTNGINAFGRCWTASTSRARLSPRMPCKPSVGT